jgi:putative thioredoxin
MNDASQSNWVIDVGDEDFEQEVLQRSKEVPVVVDFWAPWCQPCRLLGPMLEEHARLKAGSFVVAKVNVDESPNLAAYFQVEGIPTVHVIRNGQMYPGFQGVLSKAELSSFIDGIFPTETENALKEAQSLETGEPAKAETIYRGVLAKQPADEAARLGLARLLVGRHEFAESAQLLAPLGDVGEVGVEAERLRRIIELESGSHAGGNDSALRQKIAADPESAQPRYELGSLLASQGKYPEALEILLTAAERDKKFAQNQVKELMVKIFQIIGVRSELADDYRSRLQSLLY